MIVPRSRLLFYVALVGLPGSTLAGMIPALLIPCLGLMGVLLVVVLADAFRLINGGKRIEASLPDLVKSTVNADGIFLLTLSKKSKRPLTIRVGIRLSGNLGAAYNILEVSLPAGHDPQQISWPIHPQRRGDYQLAQVHISIPSRLGFWSYQYGLPVTSRISVYPNLEADRKQLAALFLNHGSIGLHSQRQVGQGRDVEKLREYLPGDGFETIHWKATARRGQPITKVYQVERTQEIYAIIDASRLSARTAPQSTETLVERFINAATMLGLAAQKQGDHFGLIAFNDRIARFVPSGHGSSHANACREALYNLHASKTSPDFEELTTFVRVRLRRRALLVFLTSLDDPLLGEHFLECAKLLRRKHLVFAPVLEQSGVMPFFDQTSMDTPGELYTALGSHLVWEKERELQNALRVAGVQTATVKSDLLCAQMVSHYLNIKRRQLL